MKKHIVINLDEPFFAPSTDMTLLNMIVSGGFHWPDGATCVTQECDGELCWWGAPIVEVKKARLEAKKGTGLLSIFGLRWLRHADYFAIEDQDVVAKDWQESVVTLDDFTRQG